MSVSGIRMLMRARECSLPSEGVARGWDGIEWSEVMGEGECVEID